MDTFKKIQAIFYSGSHSFRGSLEPVNDIAFLLDEGYLALTTASIGSKQDYDALLDSVLAHEHAHNLAAGGGKNHVALKLLAASYLSTRGYGAIQYEHPLCGHYPDVMTRDASIVVECGHTQNPEKMLTYFQQGNIKECIQIPYPVFEDTEVLGYSFTAQDELKEFLDFLEADRRSQLKKITRASNPPG